ncbi:DUF4199 domain-containing protein [Pontibacter silvestris]|uniref:DUF4199 domain-containing protein n=1 Tax=Pontibacter silvestris TaxID=2305183 RepID=A0ABW4WVL4_9BACT|nr:DUF4199 domain-containing protein [Pontibacter silvestris]MCC9137988.1 DUF4199 domain-containing protein [Pontibacter silvestris]
MEKVGLKYGVFTALGLIVYFLLMMLLGFEKVLELRFFNAVIMAVGVCLAIRGYKISVNGDIPYLKGIGTGFLTALVGSALFAVFMLVYTKTAGGELIEAIAADNMFGDRMESTPGVVIFMVLMVEGIISGFLISFIAMQWFKKPNHEIPGGPNS